MDWQQQMLMQSAGRLRRLRDLRDHSTCPHCLAQWRASRDDDWAVQRDFRGIVTCPECLRPSRENRHLTTLFAWDGHREPVHLRAHPSERGADR